MSISAAWLRASAGDMVPSVRTSRCSLSWLVSLPIWIGSVLKSTLITGVKIASKGIAPTCTLSPEFAGS